MLRIALAVVHLGGMAIGVGAIYSRARALNRVADGDTLRRGLIADTWWGISFLLLLVTGLWRAFAGLEKSPSYYWNNQVFWTKMGLLAAILTLEVWPMITLIRWRIAQGRGALPSTDALGPTARRIARISDVQMLFLFAMIVAAVMMARGYGFR
ncbi:MAG: DUF2214 family protein [Gemmatimonadaceae bacterium]